jgi:hypothetical protein
MWGEMSFCLVTFTDTVVLALNLASYLFLRIFAVVSSRCRLSVRAVRQPWSKTNPTPEY